MAWIIDPEEILDEINWRVGSNIAEPPASKTTDWGVSNDVKKNFGTSTPYGCSGMRKATKDGFVALAENR